MKNIEIKAMVLGTTSKILLDSFQTYDEWKRQWKKVARGEKACAYIPMWRPFKVEKETENKNGEKEKEEKTLFHISLVAIFHEGQLEGNEWKTLDKTIIENIERVLKEHWLYNVSKEDYVKNVRAFEKRCKQYDDKVQVEEEKKEEEELEQVEVVEEPKAIEKRKTIEESRREFEEWAREIEKQLAEESIETEEEEEEEIDTTSKDNDPDYWF